MSTQANAIPSLPSQAAADIGASRRMYWLVRREVWENRYIYIVPAAVEALALAGFLIFAIRLPAKIRAASALGLMEQHKIVSQPFMIAGGLMMLTTLAVGFFYCLDALYGERRDRSVLFWKSLPVSDLETVVSKAITPIVIMPLINFGFAVVTEWIMLLASSAVLAASGLSVAALWTHGSLFQTWVTLLYHLITVHGLWYAPIFGWLLLVSAWARRAPILWATLPPLVIAAVEKIAFNTTHFGALLVNRMLGGPGPNDNFMASGMAMDPLMHFTPDQFLYSPGLWIGLAIAAIFLAGAVRLRRSQGAI